MVLNDYGKLIVLVALVAGAFAVILTGTGDTTPAWATITLVAGYVVGNGRLAQTGKAPSAVFRPKTDDEQ